MRAAGDRARLESECRPGPTCRRAPCSRVRDLRVEFDTDDGVVTAVDDLSFDVQENEVLAVVGESGSGKSVTALSVMGLLPRAARVTGEVLFRGEPLLGLDDRDLSKLRGRRDRDGVPRCADRLEPRVLPDEGRRRFVSSRWSSSCSLSRLPGKNPLWLLRSTRMAMGWLG